ncbi:MAG TPA: ketol-acid reductoisomerase [Candidatus Paceibacterota bacterium]
MKKSTIARSSGNSSRRKRVLFDKDANPSVLQGKTLAVIGYGSQGHAHALNLRDSGNDVIIGLKPDSKSIDIAMQNGFTVLDVEDAVRNADIILVATPDMVQPDLYRQEIKSALKPGSTLVFSHGLSIHFGLIKPRSDINVVMVAPKGPGHLVRRLYEEGKGIPSLIAVAQGGRKARQIALAWAHGIGATRAGVIETSFKEETETDLFGEQAVLCGGLTALATAGFETLVEAGYAPEMAYFECLHELKLIIDLMYEKGISGMRFSISETAKWGDVETGPKIIDRATRRRMERVLKDIQSGKFVRGWVREYKAGLPNYHRKLQAGTMHQLEVTGARLRGLMPWMPKRSIKGPQAAYAGAGGKN